MAEPSRGSTIRSNRTGWCASSRRPAVAYWIEIRQQTKRTRKENRPGNATLVIVSLFYSRYRSPPGAFTRFCRGAAMIASCGAAKSLEGMMSALTSDVIEQTSAPSIAPGAEPIDLVHLRRMTLGERSLEREVLQLFCRQADMLVARMQKAKPAVAAASAHTLMGSARGIGTWRVAATAETVERVATAEPAKLPRALVELIAAVDEAKMAIADLLRAQ
jgi:HPt (histidine-containing phosphotransfer) domain-containing protein